MMFDRSIGTMLVVMLAMGFMPLTAEEPGGEAPAAPEAESQEAEGAELDERAREIGRLIEDLGAADWPVRDAATNRLEEVGEAAIPALEEATESDNAERAARAEELLRKIRGEPVEEGRSGTPQEGQRVIQGARIQIWVQGGIQGQQQEEKEEEPAEENEEEEYEVAPDHPGRGLDRIELTEEQKQRLRAFLDGLLTEEQRGALERMRTPAEEETPEEPEGE